MTKTAKTLEVARQRALLEISSRLGQGDALEILVCQGTGCCSSRGQAVFESFLGEIKEKNLVGVRVQRTGCFGLCALGPVVVVHPGGHFYNQVTPETTLEILKNHIQGQPAKNLLYEEEGQSKPLFGTNFFKKQTRRVLKNCGLIDPENIFEYIAVGGYGALSKSLCTMTSEEIIAQVEESGLRGRGGGGFPTGKKWRLARDLSRSPEKYVCCNADEGDPGAFMDRSILESDPHSVIEAMAIAGFAIGAKEGCIYVRAEYPMAVNRLKIAISQAKEQGLLGENILGSNFSFEIDLRLGAGAFVCGEETALIASIEGQRGEPTQRPPFPAQSGLFGKPTLINNVETFANIPQIILNGAAWFREVGPENSPGTKVFALGGKVTHTGLVEVAMDTTLREIVFEIGGGVPGGKDFKAAQTGGPSGGCITEKHLDLPIDYESLAKIGSMVGSGGLIIMDENTCMVDIAKFFLEFTVDESCGKCTPCRIGTKRILEILQKITSGEATLKDLEKLENLCAYIKENSLCGLGQTAPNPVLSTITNFKGEYLCHIEKRTCPAGVCKKLLCYKILPEKCRGCTLCARKCPTGAISGRVKEAHIIGQALCIKCGACEEACKFDAIVKI